MCSTAPPALIDYCKEPGTPKRNCLCPVTSKEKSGEARVDKCPPHYTTALAPWGKNLSSGPATLWGNRKDG